MVVRKLKYKKILSLVFILMLLFSINNIKKAKAEQTVLKLIDAGIIDKSDDVTALIDDFGDKELVTNVVFHKVNSYVKYKLTIRNTSENDYKIKSIEDNNDNDNIEYTYTYSEDLLESGNNTEIIVKMIYKESVNDMSKRDQDGKFNISFVVEDVEGNTYQEDVEVNPKTNDDIQKYVVLGVVSLVGLILIIVSNKKIRKLFIIALLLMPITIYALSVTLVIKVTYTLGLHDKVIISKSIDGVTTEEIVDYGFEVENLETPQKDGYTFKGWYIGNELFDSSSKLTEDTAITAKYEIINYDISYSLDGGSESSNPTEYNIETNTFTLKKPTKTGYSFLGWTGSNGNIPQTTVTIEKGTTGNKSYVAHWSEKMICIPATEIHTSTCGRTSGGCFAAGYTLKGKKGTTTITFGKLPDSETMKAGFAYNCDVNADDIYDSETERFYYLRTLNGNAVLISNNNFEGVNGQKNENIFGYDSSINQFPTTEQWSNMRVTFNGKAARYPTREDLYVVTGKYDLSAEGSLDDYTYLMENTRFISQDAGRSGVWIEKEDTIYRYHTVSRNVMSSTTNNGVRPVIEVPLELIDKSYTEIEYHTVTFNSLGALEFDSRQIEHNHTIGELPIPEKEGYEFEGWYSDSTYETKVENTTVVENDMTLYAKWKDMKIAEIDGRYFTSVQKAVDSVTTNSEEVTIKLLLDAYEVITIQKNKNIAIDLNNKTISNKKNESIIKNNGNLRIFNGNINSSAGNGAVNNNQGGSLTLSNVKVVATGTRQAVYNDGGTLIIDDNTYLEASSTERATLQNTNKSGGSVTIKSATIISNNQQGISNANTLVIGQKDNNYDISNIVIKGKTYGITTTTNISVYDGIIKGVTAAIDNEARITDIEDSSTKTNNTEDIDEITYKVLFYTIG